MNSGSQVTIIQDLASLGCGFYSNPPQEVPDPEKVIINSLKLFWTDHKLFTMLLSTLTHRIHSLIHVERLLSFAEDISDDERIILMVIADKMVDLGDRRFNLLITKLKKRGLRVSSIPEIHTQPYFIKKWGLDPNFLKFKIEVPKYFEQPEKKFYTLRGILDSNPWLKIRALVGANYRADLIYLKFSGRVKTPTEALQVLSCSKATVYRLWDSISLVENLEKLIA
ncbi:MAG: hypothetical protein H6626_15245 [Pseudobdellovibrionaceae bacterium]|nr:MAG: hypothetical protein H6626_15245 [Pseudobdellovibrionaceae bacterium]